MSIYVIIHFQFNAANLYAGHIEDSGDYKPIKQILQAYNLVAKELMTK